MTKRKATDLDALIAEAEDHISNPDGHALLVEGWVWLRDAAIKVIEDEKRYDLLYGDGRKSKGKGKDENLSERAKSDAYRKDHLTAKSPRDETVRPPGDKPGERKEVDDGEGE